MTPLIHRYLTLKSLGKLKVEDFEVILLLPDEKDIRAACNRVRSRLYAYKETMRFRWSVRWFGGRELIVKKIGKFSH